MLKISGRDLARAFGKLEHRSRDATCDPDSQRSANGQTKQGQNQIGVLEPKIRRQFLVERSLQKCDRISILRRQLDGITQECLAAYAEIDNLFRGQRFSAQDPHQCDAPLFIEGGAEGIRSVQKRDIQIGIGLYFPCKIIVDTKSETEPGDWIGSE